MSYDEANNGKARSERKIEDMEVDICKVECEAVRIAQK